MSKKRLLIMLIVMLGSLAMSGCVDLFAVPGIAVSPDGTKIYFLGSDVALTDLSADSPDSLQFSVAAFGGSATPIMEGFGAFAVNPANGDVIFSSGLEEDVNPQTFLMRYSNGEATLFVGPEAFGGNNFLATQMAFSADGSRLAMTGIVLPPTEELSNFGEELTPEQIAQFDAVVYLVNPNGGSVTLISDPNTAWANTLAWSPSGQYLAYNAWVDTNGDGAISTTGGFTSLMDMSALSGTGTAPTSDLSQIFIYDVNSGQTTQVNSTAVSYAPAFVSDSQLAYATLDIAFMMFGTGGAINVYDLGSGSSTVAFQSQGTILGIARAPNGSQVAWTQLGATDPATGNSSNELYVADTAFSNPTLIANLGSELGFVDAPVWMPDSSGVLIASTNIFATMMGSMTAAFSGMAGAFGELSAELGAEATVAPPPEIPTQQVELVKVPSGETSVVYSGVMINSNFFASVIGLAGSGDMESMFDISVPTPAP